MGRCVCCYEKNCLNKRLLNDFKYLTNFNHTGTLEVYHSLYNKYSPKCLYFSYPVMIARAQLVVLDFNSGVGLAHRKKKQRTNFQKLSDLGSLKKYTKGRKGNVQKPYHGRDKASGTDIL